MLHKVVGSGCNMEEDPWFIRKSNWIFNAYTCHLLAIATFLELVLGIKNENQLTKQRLRDPEEECFAWLYGGAPFVNSRKGRIFTHHFETDLNHWRIRGRQGRPRPRWVQFFSFHAVLGKIGQVIGWRPSSGKSWIRHCEHTLRCTCFDHVDVYQAI